MSYTTSLSSKGQLTLPVQVRKALSLKEGDQVEFYRDRAGQFHMRAVNRGPEAFLDALPSRRAGRAGLSDDAAIGEAVRRRDQRAQSRRAAAE